MIIDAPNNVNKTNRANGSFPQPRSASPVDRNDPANHKNGSFPQPQSASPINPPNAAQKFTPADAAAEHAKTYNAPAAVQPGKGAVPVNPGLAGGGAMPPSVMSRGR